MLLEEAVDGGLEVYDEAEDAVLQALPGEFGEDALDRVQPGTGGGREVEGPMRMAFAPLPDLDVLVGGVVVEDDMDGLARRMSRSISLRKRMNS